jgi:hypothetical protein
MAKRKLGRSNDILTDEISLYADNDGDTFERCIYPLQKSGIKMAEKKKFSAKKFCKAMRTRCLPVVLKNYKKDFDLDIKSVTTADRNVIGANMCKSSITTMSDDLGKNILRMR